MSVLYLFVAGALFRGLLQDYPYDAFGEKWPVCLVLAGVIMVGVEIKRWRNRHG